MAVQDGVNDRQTRAVIAVGVSAQLVLQHMALEVGDLADFQHAVFCHGGGPRQLTAGIVILRVGQQNADVADDAAHDGLVDVIGKTVFIRLAEVGFHRVAQRVERAGNNLLHGNGQRVAGVKERELRLRAPKSALDLLSLVGDDGPVVHLAAGTEHSDNRAEGNKLGRQRMLRVLHLPDVLVQLRLCGDDLAAVGNAAAAHGENQIDVIFTRQLRALLHLGISGVRHDTGELHDAFACGIQDTHDLIVHAVALDRAAAVGQHDGFAVVPQQTAEILFHAALAEIHLGLVFKNKVVHKNASFLNVISSFAVPKRQRHH